MEGIIGSRNFIFATGKYVSEHCAESNALYMISYDFYSSKRWTTAYSFEFLTKLIRRKSIFSVRRIFLVNENSLRMSD